MCNTSRRNKANIAGHNRATFDIVITKMKIVYIGLFFALAFGQAATVSPLYSRGYTVMPEPQVVKLGASDFVFASDWRIETHGVPANDVAVETLKEELDQRFRLRLVDNGGKVVHLTVSPGAVTIGRAQDRERNILAQQAYKIDLASTAITVTANAPNAA